MLNDFVKEIIAQYGSSNSEGIIDWNYRTKLAPENFEIIRKAFDLSEQRLSYLDCTGDDCYEEIEVKTRRDGSQYIHCSYCKKLELLTEDQDLAHKMTLDGLADFVIGLLEIEQNKKPIKLDDVLYLGKKSFVGIFFDFYLTRTEQGKRDLINDLKLNTKKNRPFIIKINNDIGDSEEETSFWFCHIIFYDKKTKKFTTNNDLFHKLTTSLESNKIELHQQSVIADNNKKYATGGKNKRSAEKEFFKEEFKKAKHADTTRDDKEIILEIWDLNKSKVLNNLSKTNGLRTLNEWHKKFFKT
jgi:hypothetical protein